LVKNDRAPYPTAPAAEKPCLKSQHLLPTPVESPHGKSIKFCRPNFLLIFEINIYEYRLLRYR
jgi:hypothetical protein